MTRRTEGDDAVTLKTITALTIVAGLSFSHAAFAAGSDEPQQPTVTITANSGRTISVPVSSLASLSVPAPKRPAILPALYASLGAMQAWDIYSTSQALKAGARESNPAAANFVDNAGAMIGLKAATTASTIFFTERLWRKNRVAAIVVMTAINGATAAVAVRNMQNARGLVR